MKSSRLVHEAVNLLERGVENLSFSERARGSLGMGVLYDFPALAITHKKVGAS